MRINADEGFQQKYFDTLKAGGTKHHSELLAFFGFDASDPDFWKGSGGRKLTDELERSITRKVHNRAI